VEGESGSVVKMFLTVFRCDCEVRSLCVNIKSFNFGWDATNANYIGIYGAFVNCCTNCAFALIVACVVNTKYFIDGCVSIPEIGVTLFWKRKSVKMDWSDDVRLQDVTYILEAQAVDLNVLKL
jgi:hypothetical protein